MLPYWCHLFSILQEKMWPLINGFMYSIYLFILLILYPLYLTASTCQRTSIGSCICRIVIYYIFKKCSACGTRFSVIIALYQLDKTHLYFVYLKAFIKFVTMIDDHTHMCCRFCVLSLTKHVLLQKKGEWFALSLMHISVV